MDLEQAINAIPSARYALALDANVFIPKSDGALLVCGSRIIRLGVFWIA
jgi:hypothetical protein